MKMQFIVETVTGNSYTSTVEDYSDEELEEVGKFLEGIKIFKNFSIGTVEGMTVHFNPQHTVSIACKEIK